MIIRKAAKNDAMMIYRAHVASIRELCSCMYTPSQVQAWTDGLSPDRYLQGMENLEFHVAASDDGRGPISGLLIFNKQLGEIYALYVAPWAVHQGLGRRFMDLAESVIRKHGNTSISLKSSPNAVLFYEHRGYECAGESVHELHNGERLPCMRMTKTLA